MEYPSRNDFFLKFKALYSEKDRFMDYILMDASDNLNALINYKINTILGKKVSDIVLENENCILGLKYLSYHMIPKTRRKFEIYNEELEMLQLVNIFSDEKDFMLIFYTDITRYKANVENPPIGYVKNYEKSEKLYL